MDSFALILFVLVLAVIVLIVFLNFVPLGLWISALASGVHVSIGTLIGMKIRRIQPKRLIYPLIQANKAGLDLSVSKLETHFLAGGNVDRVINALIAAQRANIEMAFEKACAIDLAGR
ncbi:MAG: flotillin-like FloA family protein, partial [Eubacteriales bacterium]|nr:flotillin-like FloA family protein [Eubacteriales bacterium]